MAILRMCLVALAVALLRFLSQRAAAGRRTKHEPALDVTSMDRTIDPCVDFFTYSCGGWIKSNPIPPDQSSWDTYSKMQDENLGRLRGILEAASAPDPKRNAVDAENRRLLCLLHGRESDRRQRRGAAEAAAGTNCADRAPRRKSPMWPRP